MTGIIYREAKSHEGALILQFVKDLAIYEKLAHEVTATQELIEEALFGVNPKAFCFIAEVDEKPAGFALCFYNFSTFLGKPGIYIEDLYVNEQYRGRGIGRGFFTAIAEKAAQENCGRIQWAVLDWNIDAINFYKSMGAQLFDDWRICRVEGNDIVKLAENKIKKAA